MVSEQSLRYWQGQHRLCHRQQPSDNKNPQPQDCGQSGEGGLGGSGEVLLSCEWENICIDSSECTPTRGTKWSNVRPVTGVSTLLSDNLPITLTAGGNYGSGIPAIMVGFKEPLTVSVISISYHSLP